MSALGLSLRRPSVTSSTTSAMTIATSTTPDEDAPPSILLNGHEGSGSAYRGRSGSVSANTNSYPNTNDHDDRSNSRSSSLGYGRPSVSRWREYNSELAGSASSFANGSDDASSSQSQSQRVSFAPLPEIPNELRRHNSIALGVVARRDLIKANQGARPKGKQDYQVVYMSDEEWEDYQKQYRESAGVVDLGQVAKSGARKLWKKVRSNTSSSSEQSAPLSPPNQKAFWRSRGTSPSPTMSSSFSSQSLASSPMILPAHMSGTSTPLEKDELQTVHEEERTSPVLAPVGEKRMRSPPPGVQQPLEEEEEEDDAEAEDEDEGYGDRANHKPAAETLNSYALETLEPERQVESPVYEIPSRVATPRPRRNSSGLHPEPINPHAARDAAVIGYNEAVHIR